MESNGLTLSSFNEEFETHRKEKLLGMIKEKLFCDKNVSERAFETISNNVNLGELNKDNFSDETFERLSKGSNEFLVILCHWSDIEIGPLGFGYPYDDIVIERFNLIRGNIARMSDKELARYLMRYTMNVMGIFAILTQSSDERMINIIYSLGHSIITNRDIKKLNKRLKWGLLDDRYESLNGVDESLYYLYDHIRNLFMDIREKVKSLERNDLIILFLYCIRVTNNTEEDLFLLECFINTIK